MAESASAPTVCTRTFRSAGVSAGSHDSRNDATSRSASGSALLAALLRTSLQSREVLCDVKNTHAFLCEVRRSHVRFGCCFGCVGTMAGVPHCLDLVCRSPDVEGGELQKKCACSAITKRGRVGRSQGDRQGRSSTRGSSTFTVPLGYMYHHHHHRSYAEDRASTWPCRWESGAAAPWRG